MRRPIGVICIAWFIFLWGTYLFLIGFARVLPPQEFRTIATRPLFLYSRFVPAWSAPAAGGLWMLTAWGLYRMHNWARWVVMLVALFGLVFTVPKLVFDLPNARQATLLFFDAALRTVIFGYLFVERTSEKFSPQARANSIENV